MQFACWKIDGLKLVSKEEGVTTAKYKEGAAVFVNLLGEEEFPREGFLLHNSVVKELHLLGSPVGQAAQWVMLCGGTAELHVEYEDGRKEVLKIIAS